MCSGPMGAVLPVGNGFDHPMPVDSGGRGHAQFMQMCGLFYFGASEVL